MLRNLKLTLLLASKYLGVFWLFRRINRGGIRILCYHGFGLAPDQSRFRPKLFMDPSVFRRRMQWLRDAGYQVVSLSDAAESLNCGRHFRDAVVITMDDGFYGCFVHGVPIAQAFGYPTTVYVTTWYVENGRPLPHIAVQYIFWRSGKSHIATDVGTFSESEASSHVIGLDATLCMAFLAKLARAAGIEGSELKDRRFSLMNASEIKLLAQAGVDIQLHTHRHRWPEQLDELTREIADNKRVLTPLTAAPLEHLCYPSGAFSQRHWPLLRALGIRTATTLEHGIADLNNNMLRLPRLLDGTNVTEIEFEAQMCGLPDVGNWARRVIAVMSRRAIWHALPAQPQ